MATRKTIDQLEAENEALRAELDRLRSKQALTMFGNVSAAPRSAKMTIVGLEEMILSVGEDDTVGYVNTSMMKLLGIADRAEALGTPLGRWDDGPLGDKTLTAIAQAARSSDETLAFERPFPDIPRDLLPTTDVPSGADESILRFTASSQKGRVQIVLQDVTRTRWLESTFARYLSPKVIERMQGIGADDLLCMERRDLTILFCDLRGFTTLCQEAEPEDVRETINSYLSNMVDCVERLDGTVQGFVGDEVMAIFGAPLPQEDHALRALICAVEMQRVHGEWIADRSARARPAPGMGVGLATGEVVVGNIGTESRMDYTAQGHGVNLAARLCGAAAAGEVLTVPATHRAAMGSLGDWAGDVPIPRLGFAPKGKLSLKNVKQPAEVLSVRIKP